MDMDFSAKAREYEEELFRRVVPFWLEKSQDGDYGGYFTCLDREGGVFDTDKFVWLQAREVWLFAMLCNRVEKRPEWLACAVQGGEFLRRWGHDGAYNWYFALTREGRPTVAPYNIFSYTFAAMAFAQLHLATGEPEYARIARKTFDRILERRDNPKGQWNKATDIRPLKGFSLPMILCNLALEIEQLIEPERLQMTVDECLHEVTEVFYRPELGLIVENVAPDGSLSDSFDGRLLNPGHAMEATWFIMDLGQRFGRSDLIGKALRIALRTVEYGWDGEYGGIFYFMDRKGYPPQQLEWDQKLWWVHMEAMIALLEGYRLTGSEEALEWFRRVEEYAWGHFRDPQFSEWYGYLDRRGEVLLPLKGGKWKGCFHIPRGLYKCMGLFEELARMGK